MQDGFTHGHTNLGGVARRVARADGGDGTRGA
jgi:hypothetical protein